MGTDYVGVVPTVTSIVRDALRELRASGDAKRRAGMRAYFKRDKALAFHGVPVPRVKQIARGIAARVGTAWAYRDALAFCDALVQRRELESKLLGLLVLSRYHREFPRAFLGVVQRWLVGNRLASWAAVDAVCPWVVTPLLECHPELRTRVMKWTQHRNVWLRRAAAVAFVPLARHGRRLRDAYTIAESLLPDEHDLIHKATGWLLREAGKTDPVWLEGFLRRRGPAIPRTAVRYAIERYPPAKRRRLLESTR